MSEGEKNVWEQVLIQLRTTMDGDDFRRWFGATFCASDSGDQVVVWVTSEPIRRHLLTHFQEQIHDALGVVGRPHVQIRFVVAELSDSDDDQNGS